MYKFIFNQVKNIIPKISNTELIALRSGTTSLDRQIFKGSVKLPKPVKYTKDWETEFKNKNVSQMLKKYGDYQNIYPNNNYHEIIDYLGKNKYFSFIIPEEYDGLKMSTQSLSEILTKIASKNASLGVITMVPNSLGPGELLSHYGTKNQKDKYLPKLSCGEYVPCFGLTGPNNGSDATGSIDQGTVFLRDNKKYIKVNINKRYITLAPVANLIGLAFDLKDPDNLLEKGMEGVTLALLEKGHPGLLQESFHNPLDVGFPNGTLKGEFEFCIDSIIGGEEQAGNGWKMLMECLAAGRAISLPATANAASKVATYGIYNYSSHRKQFKIPLIQMEAIQNKFADMLYNTWCIHTSIELTNQLLDSGEKPAVISAIMKQQTTERARQVINHGMDIHAGSSICLGQNNFLSQFYQSSPVGITVEGSNTLTKNLIIFGQGINKSHPHISDLLENILESNHEDFKNNFNLMIKHVAKCYSRSLNNFNPIYQDQIELQTVNFANLANFVALLGGQIKSNQFLSGDMADIFSNLYLAYSIKWYHNNNPISQKLSDYCINRLANENRVLFNRVIDNYPIIPLKPLLYPMRSKIHSENYNNSRDLIKEIKNNKNILDTLTKDIYIDGVLEKMEKLNSLNPEQLEYNQLYNQIIQVEEFPIKEN